MPFKLTEEEKAKRKFLARSHKSTKNKKGLSQPFKISKTSSVTAFRGWRHHAGGAASGATSSASLSFSGTVGGTPSCASRQSLVLAAALLREEESREYEWIENGQITYRSRADLEDPEDEDDLLKPIW